MQRLSLVASVVSRLAAARARSLGVSPTPPVPPPAALLRGVLVRDRPLSSPRDVLNELSATEQSLLHLRSTSAAFPPPRLLVIDSIAAPFRGAEADDPTAHDAARRAELLFAIGCRLRELATAFGLAVLVTNQVADDLGNEARALAPALQTAPRTPFAAATGAENASPAANGAYGAYTNPTFPPPLRSASLLDRRTPPKPPSPLPSVPPPPLPPPDASLPARGSAFPLRTSGRLVRPALGLAWSSAGPSTRLFLSREETASGGGGRPVRREARVVFSSFLPERAVALEMSNDGLQAFAAQHN